MRKRIRKLIAIVSVVALVISSFATYSAYNDVKADTWTEVPGMNGTYAYRINSNNLTGFVRLNFYTGGDIDYLQVIGDGNSGLADATVTLNNATQAFDPNGFYREHSAPVVGFKLTDLPNKEYYNITVTGTGGAIDFTVKKGTPGTPAVQPTNVVATAVSGVQGAAEVTWQCQNPYPGQTYNVYVDDALMKTGVSRLYTTVNNLSYGTHIVEVCGVFSGEETERTSTTVNISSTVKSTSNISIEGFQIQTNFPDRSDPPDHVAFRSMCKAPNKGSKMTIDDKQYEVDKFGIVYALDYENNTGYNENNNLDASYTLLNETPVVGEDWTYEGLRTYDDNDVAYGFVATNKAIIEDYKPADTDNTYYAITMPNMDPMARCTIFFRAYVVATDGTIIYGKTTAYTSVCEIADIIYSNSMSKNASSHDYIYNGILHNTSITPATNPHYKASPITYGWNGNLYIGFRKVPDSWNSSTHTTEEMQYISVGDYNIHASSFYDNPELDIVGAAASYKGFTNEEMAVRIDQPGWGHLDEWQNFINWGVQIKLPNRTAYARLEDGKTYKMTVLYRATNAGEMKMKCEGIDTLPVYFNAVKGMNKIEKTFTFHNGYMNLSNDASIVFAPCGDDDTVHPGFPRGTIVSDFDVSFTEID